MKTILITGAGSPAGKALIGQLRDRTVHGHSLVLVGADVHKLEDASLARSVVLPPAHDPEFTVALRHVIGEARVDLVIPTVAEELPIFAGLEAVLAENPLRRGSGDPLSASTITSLAWTPPPMIISPPTATAVAADTLHTMWALDAADVTVPAFVPASRFVSTAEALDAIGGPITVEPRRSRGRRGMAVVEHPNDLEWSTLAPGHLVQAFVPGTEYSPQVFRSWNTGSTDVVVLELTALRDERVGNASAARRAQPGEADDVTLLAQQTAEALGIIGPADLDVRRREDGTPVVLGVNARFGACSALAPEILDTLLDEVFHPSPHFSRAFA